VQPAAPPSAGAAPKPKPAAVDGARLLAANSDPGNWMSPGRTYDEQHFSPLQKVNADNVKQLGLAWFYDLDTAHRG
jgi:quinohemoprotein ethanol dehydrogenase